MYDLEKYILDSNSLKYLKTVRDFYSSDVYIFTMKSTTKLTEELCAKIIPMEISFLWPSLQRKKALEFMNKQQTGKTI